MMLAFDDAGYRRPRRETFTRARKAEHSYGRALRRVARAIGDIVQAFAGSLFDDDPTVLPNLQQTLERYAQMLGPWAEAVGRRMLADVDRRDAQSWAEYSREMSLALRQELRTAPTGHALREAMARQVDLITSLPREASQRVHRLAMEGLSSGARASEIADEIMKTGSVTRSRANTIARTEVSRAATMLTAARAQHIGSSEFIWRTVGDSDVRPSHRKLNGKVFRWDNPPECDPGHHALPGAIWNCRCVPEPVVPETF